jgi:hypothetical protein
MAGGPRPHSRLKIALGYTTFGSTPQHE